MKRAEYEQCEKAIRHLREALSEVQAASMYYTEDDVSLTTDLCKGTVEARITCDFPLDYFHRQIDPEGPEE
jgi:N-acetylglutamate synthase/N-acetylornithine aminotransferase